MSVTYRLLEGIPAGDDRAAWDGLATSDPHGTVFHRPRFLETWHEQLGHDVEPYVVAVGDGEPVGVAALAVARSGAPEEVRFLGGTEVADYLGPVAAAGDRAPVAEAVLAAARELVADARFVAGGLAEDSGWVEAFERAADGEPASVGQDGVCPVVDVSGGHDAYLEGLPGKQRHEQRRKARKLARDLGAVELVTADPSQLDAALDRFLDLATAADAEKSRFFLDDDMQRFFTALTERLGPEGLLRIDLLDVADEPAAATISLVDGRRWGLYNSAFDPVIGMLAPGMVLVAELIRVAADDGFEVFDLLRGDEPYKYRFGATDRAVRRVVIG